ncbi:MAG TPA: RNA polymerase sigma factor [Candidatus Acidoferrum sp.]|nr:RNA polymerase sigma factor [Candidatus Acidoferrum sp.]
MTATEPTDHALMQQVAAGNSGRLALLFDRYQKRLFNFFLRLGFAHTTSDDLVQDTFLRVLRHAGSYRGDGFFVGWLFQIARNVAANHWHQQADWQALEDDEDLQLPVAFEHEPAALHEQAALERRLRRALLRLPRDSRELVLLARLKELSGEELAQLFGCSVSAVKVRLHRALIELRRHFDAVNESGMQVEAKSHECRNPV